MKQALLIVCLLFVAALQAQVLTSSNLPIISITTNGLEIPNDPKITASMGIIFNPANARNHITDAFNHYNGKIGIELRGQSSQQFPMKSYSIELRDGADKSIDQSLFGLPKESDWVLYAPYTDKSLMRNFLAYTMSREMGRWASNCRYVELVVNGEYKGIYVFMEKIKRNNGRVNITKINPTDISGDAVTGGYIFSIDKEADGWISQYKPFKGTSNQFIQYSYIAPKLSAIVPEQQEYLKKYIDSFELALYQSKPNKQTNWRNFAEEASFIDYMIVNEVSRNIDGYRLSSYFYKDRQSKGGKIIAGPVWDYDLAFRNANYCKGSDTIGWAYQFNSICPQDYWQVPFWWDQLMDDATFKSNLRCRWKQLRSTSLSLSRINTLIDSVVTLTAEARQRHFQQWPILGTYVWPNPQPIAGSYEEEIEYLKTWVTKRLTWLDNHIPNEGACYDYPIGIKESVLISGLPNPVQTQYLVTIKSRLQQTISIIAVDMAGRIVYRNNQTVNAGYNQLPIDMSRLQKGVYQFQFQSAAGENIKTRVLKQ
jgi:hypothetical protein